MTLELSVGMASWLADNTAWRGSDEGTMMKKDYGWAYGGNGTNSTGFSALPSGKRESDGSFSQAGEECYWWSSSPANSDGRYRRLAEWTSGVYRSYHSDDYDFISKRAFSVRCIQDAE